MNYDDFPDNFKQFSALYKDRVYSKICEYLDRREPEEYRKMIRVYVDRKGQYRRPSYVLLWCALYGGDLDEAILPAAVQQASEDWILIHDDIMDGNLVRRGAPSAHALYGTDNAMLAGDNLHMIMWRMAKDAADSLGKERGDMYFNKLYDMMDITHVGQFLDTKLGHGVKDITKFTDKDYYKSIHAKAAYYTVYGPMQAGAIVAEAEGDKIEKIVEYGTPAGLAFQITDDILDCTSTTEVLGKTIGNDVREGTKTLILWHAVNNAPSGTLNRLKEIYAKDRAEKSEEEIKFVLDTFNELGSIVYAQNEAERLGKEAAEKFDEIEADIPESRVKQLARSSIIHTVKRAK